MAQFDTSKIAILYSKALIELCQKYKITARIASNFALFDKIREKSIALEQFFLFPIGSNEKKIAIVAALSQKYKLEKIFEQFLITLLENKAYKFFDAIKNNFAKLCAELDNHKTIELTTACEMNLDGQKKIVSILEKKLAAKVTLMSKIDQKILGGAILQLDSVVIDMSLSNQLTRLQKSFKQAINAE